MTPDAVALVMVDRFDNADPTNDLAGSRPGDPRAFAGGDLDGVTRRLDHLRDLGIQTVWLTPIFAMRTEAFDGHPAYHGYWVDDLSQLAPHFGTEADLRDLVDAAHARGMRVWLDVVWNHVSFNAPLRAAHPEWFHPSAPITDWNDAAQLRDREVHGLPDLASEQPAVYEWLLESTARWLPYADGLRIDAVRHMPIDVQGRLIRDLRARADHPLTVVGEVFDGDPTRLASAWTSAGFDGVFDFPLHYALVDLACGGAPPGHLAAVLSADADYPDARKLYTFLDNHDTPRIASRCASDVERLADAYALLAHLRGTPVIAWASEHAAAGAHEPENRPAIDWAAPMPLQTPIRAALAARAADPVLVHGDTRVVHLDANLLVLARSDARHTRFVAWNSGPKQRWSGRELPPRFSTWDGPPLPARPADARVVTFRVAGLPATTAPRIVGTGARLGAWDPSRGLPTRWREGVWEAELSVPEGAVIEWKPVLPGAQPSWAAGPNAVVWVHGERTETEFRW